MDKLTYQFSSPWFCSLNLPTRIPALLQESSSRSSFRFFLAFTFSPFLVLAMTVLVPGRKSEAEVERVGMGKTSTKVAVIAVATTLLCWELVSCYGMGLGVANNFRG